MESLQPGDACVECSSRGLNHKLRYFYINLNEQLLKCESRRCLWPHTDAVSSSSDDEEEDEIARSPCISLNMDDDEFIKQLLETLTPDAKGETSRESDAIHSNCDSNLTQNVPSSSNVTKDILEESHPSATTTAPELSMPNLFAESEQQPEKAAFNLDSVNAPPFQLSVQAGDIAYTISIPQELPTPTIPLEKELPKTSTFQSPPKKASTLPRSKLQSQPKPPAAPTSNETASQFLNAIKAQPVQSARTKRNRQRSRPESSSSGGSARFSTQDVKQTLERISKQK